MDADGHFHERSVLSRLRYLERKVDGATNWLTDPQLYETVQKTCTNSTDLGTDHRVCLDGWATRGRDGCVVYDLGIRANPEFGAEMMRRYGCVVRAYDPSPISQRWWAGNQPGTNTSLLQELKAAGSGKYTFSRFGAGGKDGPLKLFEYNWNQVSIFHAENDQSSSIGGGNVDVPPQEFSLEAKTLPTMMHDNGDTYIDIMKIDIEGSEYMFLQDMFDRMGCPPVGQIELEWHHFSSDARYGSPPEINALHNLLNSCGYKMFFDHGHWRYHETGATDIDDNPSKSTRALPPMRYGLSSYCKDC